MNSIIRASGLATATLSTLFLLSVSGAAAQELSWSSSAETGGDDLNLLYTQVSITPGGLGWQPVGTLAAYWVGTDNSDTWALTPQVGMRYRADGGYVQAKVGYSFKNEDAIDFFGGGEDGVVTNAHGEYWGDGTWAAQGIASLNWGSDYLWSRARLLRRIADVGDGGGVSLGGELVWQGDMEEEEELIDDVLQTRAKSSTIQAGPVLQWVSGGASIWALSGGWKQNSSGDFDDETWYLKLELTISP